MRKNNHFFRLTLLLMICCQTGTLLGNDRSVDLIVTDQVGDYASVQVQVHHAGQVLIKDAERDDSPRSLELEVDARLQFEQRFTGNKQPQAIRHYLPNCQADIKLSDGERRSELTEKNQYVISRIRGQGPIQTASIEDVLTQPEHELITTPCDPLCFPMLIHQENVKVGDRWRVTTEALASFLSVDRIFENKVQLQLREIEKNQAKLYLLGRARTEVDDVTCDVRVTATLLVDLALQKVTSVRAKITQDREIGQIAPGFSGTTKVDVQWRPIEQPDSLTNSAIAKRTRAQKIERRFKWKSDAGQFAIYYDPSWKIIASEKEAAVLRYLKHGALLAQCNVVLLPSRPADDLLTKDKFEEEVKRITAKEQSAKIVESKKLETSSSAQILSVRVDGIEQQVPVSWLYYHVSHIDGRQLTFVFTLEQDVTQEFLPADVDLVRSLKFLPTQSRSAAKESRPKR